jgi:hypothetical protein
MSRHKADVPHTFDGLILESVGGHELQPTQPGSIQHGRHWERNRHRMRMASSCEARRCHKEHREDGALTGLGRGGVSEKFEKATRQVREAPCFRAV